MLLAYAELTTHGTSVRKNFVPYGTVETKEKEGGGKLNSSLGIG